MRQEFPRLNVKTRGAGLYDVTAEVEAWVHEQGIEAGLLTLFLRHTSASLTVQENADPDVLRDLEDFFRRVVPERHGLYRHGAEGADDMPAHIRSALTLTSLGVPVRHARVMLGTWQAIYVFEHRAGSFTRSLDLHLIGD